MTNKNKKYYPEIEPAANFPKIEEKILSKWASENTFKKSISNRDKSKEFVFYDGPPFANGLPHYGHILTGFVKDIIIYTKSTRTRTLFYFLKTIREVTEK